MYGSETVVSSFFVSVFAHTSFCLSCLYLLVSINSQDYTTNPDDHSNHNIDSPGFKPFTVK